MRTTRASTVFMNATGQGSEFAVAQIQSCCNPATEAVRMLVGPNPTRIGRRIALRLKYPWVKKINILM